MRILNKILISDEVFKYLILLLRSNSKLCFEAQKMLFVPQNQLASDFRSEGVFLQSRKTM